MDIEKDVWYNQKADAWSKAFMWSLNETKEIFRNPVLKCPRS